MNVQRLKAIAWKECIHILRDPRSPILALVMPFALLLLFGSALTTDLNNVPIAIWDRAGSPTSRQLVSHFAASPYFSVMGATSYPALEAAIDRGTAKAALVLPADFDRGVSARPVAVQLIVDGSDPTVGALVMNYASAVVAGFAAERFRGRAAGGLQVSSRMLYNPDMQSKNAIVPGLIAMVLSVVAALLTSLTVAREWETGTMEQLIATPATRLEIILGKLAPYFAIGLVDVAIAVGLALLYFQVPLRGDLALVLALSGVFLLATLGTGLLISVMTRTQLLASLIAMLLTLMPSMLLSGLMFPIEAMPWPLQALSGLFPARYFVSMLLDIFLKGQGLAAIGLEVGLLSAFAFGVLALAVLGFKKRLA